MAERRTTEDYGPSPPQRGTPEETWPLKEHSWTLQELHHLTNNMGALQEAVNTLKDTVKDQGKTLNWISRTIWFTAGGIVIAGALIGYIIDKGFDRLLEVLATK